MQSHTMQQKQKIAVPLNGINSPELIGWSMMASANSRHLLVLVVRPSEHYKDQRQYD